MYIYYTYGTSGEAPVTNSTTASPPGILSKKGTANDGSTRTRPQTPFAPVLCFTSIHTYICIYVYTRPPYTRTIFMMFILHVYEPGGLLAKLGHDPMERGWNRDMCAPSSPSPSHNIPKILITSFMVVKPKMYECTVHEASEGDLKKEAKRSRREAEEKQRRSRRDEGKNENALWYPFLRLWHGGICFVRAGRYLANEQIRPDTFCMCVNVYVRVCANWYSIGVYR